MNERSEYFFPALPRWITHYGFGFIILVLIGSLTLASFIEYSNKEKFTIILNKNGLQAELNFQVYKRIKDSQMVFINGPFNNTLTGHLRKEIIYAKDNYVRTLVIVKDSNIFKLPIDSQIKCDAFLKISKGSLLKNIINY